MTAASTVPSSSTIAAGRRASPLRQAALVVGAGLGLAGGYSAAYFGTLSVFLKPIAATFGWGRAETSAVSVLAQLGIAVGAPLVGRLMDRHGAPRVIAPSVVMFALGLLLLTLLPNSLLLFGALSLLIGFVAVATAPVGYLSVLTRTFDKRLGLALGLAMLGLGSGTVVFPLVVQSWVASGGWQSAYRGVATVVLVFGALAVALVVWGSRGVSDPAASRPSQAEPAGATEGDSVGEAVRSGRFWLIGFLFFAVATAGLGAVVHLFPMLSDRGISPAVAAQGASLIGLGVMVGRFGAGTLMDYVHAPIVAALAFAMGALGLAVIALNLQASFTVIAIGAVLLGLAIGAEGDFIPYFVRRYFGRRNLGTFYGIFLCVYSLGGVAGPVLYGLAYDRLGSYSLAFGAGAMVCLGCSALALAVGKYRYVAAPAH